VTATLVALVAAGTVGTLTARGERASRLAKMTASTGFLLVALDAGALDSGFGRALLVGLGLSWAGDLLLTYRSSGAFLAGLAAFLGAHVGYVVAFSIRGISATTVVASALVLGVVSAAIVGWLWPHLGRAMRAPVVAYVVAIGAMVATALGTGAFRAAGGIPTGATLFMLSDVAVARDRFVAPGKANRLVGLPTYYAAQVLIALAASS
jgi:uncharacterized membrane protein YhhN